jgi:hypothetical protein
MHTLAQRGSALSLREMPYNGLIRYQEELASSWKILSTNIEEIDEQ